MTPQEKYKQLKNLLEKSRTMTHEKQISTIKSLIEATQELNGEYQEGWELTIEDGDRLLAQLNNNQKFIKIIKPLLEELLINNPPKRFLTGNSDWLHEIHKDLAQEGLIKGSLEPCCEIFCKDNEPCGYYFAGSTEQANEDIKELINQL